MPGAGIAWRCLTPPRRRIGRARDKEGKSREVYHGGAQSVSNPSTDIYRRTLWNSFQAEESWAGLVHNSRPSIMARQEDACIELSGLPPPAPSRLSVVAPVFAQLSNTDAPVVVGHFHLNVTSVDAHKKFWVDTLGGTAVKFGGSDVDQVSRHADLPAPAEADGPDARHRVRPHRLRGAERAGDWRRRWRRTGYQTTTGREPKPGQTAAAGRTGTPAVYGGSRTSRSRRREGRARHQRRRQRAADRLTTCTSSTSSTSRCSSGT